MGLFNFVKDLLSPIQIYDDKGNVITSEVALPKKPVGVSGNSVNHTFSDSSDFPMVSDTSLSLDTNPIDMFKTDAFGINPVNGLPTLNGIDIHGNPSGTDAFDHTGFTSDSFGSDSFGGGFNSDF